MKNIKKTVFLSMIALTTLTATSCKKEEASQATPETFFALDFNREGGSTVNVYFSTNDLSVIPEVTINGTQVVDFEVNGALVYGEYNNFPYSDEMTYSISANGKSVSGTVSMPDTLSNVTLNDEAIYIGRNNVDDLTSVLKFEWDKPVADFVKVSYTDSRDGDYDSDQVSEDVNADAYTLPANGTPDDYLFLNFNIININGVQLIADAKPNVSGDYGKGYVTAETKNEYSFQENLSDYRKSNNEKHFEQFKADFKALLEAK